MCLSPARLFIFIYFCYLSGNKEYHYFSDLCLVVLQNPSVFRGHRCRDRMILGFTSTYAISVYDHNNCEFEPRSLRGVLDTTICDKVCQWFKIDRSFSPGTPGSCVNKTDRHDITEMFLQVALNTIALTPIPIRFLLIILLFWIISKNSF